MKTVSSVCIPLLAVFILSACEDKTKEANPSPASAYNQDSVLLRDERSRFLKKYEGLVNRKIPIEMVLVNWGDGFLSGRYRIKGGGKQFELNGELLKGNEFKIIGYDGDFEHSIFSGVLADPAMITGLWSELPEGSSLPFELHESRPDTSAAAWQGNWHMNEIWDYGTLMIGNAGKDSLDFALTIVRNSHIGSIEGRAAVKGNKATFIRAEFEEKPCQLYFELEGGKHIKLDQSSSNFECGFGAGAFAGGIYYRVKPVKKVVLTAGTSPDDVFPTTALHDAFKKMTGEEFYDLFAFNMKEIEAKKLNKDGTIITGAVPGLFRTNEAIILLKNNGTIWAATLAMQQESEEPGVFLFTNDSAQNHAIPVELQSWMERFSDYPVVFERREVNL